MDEQTSSQIASFIATIPDIQSAMSVSGDGSARVKLDIPESELAEVLKFMAFGRGRALTIRVFDSGQ